MNELEQLKGKVEIVKKYTPLIMPGDKTPYIYKILKGFVRQYVISKEGIELTLKVYGEGDFFPFEEIFSDKNDADYYFETLTKAKIEKIVKENFRSFVKANSNFENKLTSKLLVLVSSLSHRMGCLVFCNAYTRTIATYIYLAEDFGQKNDSMTIIPHKFTHKDISSLAGLSRETSSAIISDLEEKHLVKHTSHGILIPDIEELNKELSTHKEKKR